MNKLDLVFIVWFSLLGTCIGSFLNVVVHRLPSGKSLLRPSSHCPACQHPIRPWHNIPIVSWLVLRGRCYDCGSKISCRYPLVEAVTGLWFFVCIVLVFFTLPTAQLSPQLLFLGLVGLILFGTALLCASLIWQDRKRVPRSILWTLLASFLLVIGTLVRVV